MLKKVIASSILIITDMLWLFFISITIELILQESIGPLKPFYMGVFNQPILYYLTILLFFVSKKIYIYHFDFWEETRRIYYSLGFSVLLVFGWLSLSQNNLEYSHSALLLTYAVLFLTVPAQKRFVKYWLVKYKLWYKPISIEGRESQKKRLLDEIRNNWYLGMHTVSDASTVIIISEGYTKEELSKKAQQYLTHHKAVFFVPTLSQVNFVDSHIFEMHNVRMSLISVENRLQNPVSQFIKLIFDILLSLVFFPCLIILFGVIIFIIRYESVGPAIFRQKRLGCMGKLFECYKFRTMYHDSDELLQAYLKEHPEEKTHYAKYHKYMNDPRITKVGRFLRKTSLDELPQLFNVIKGEMSLIGPRPYMVSERHRLNNKKTDILLVKPGITGLWQVMGRSDVDFEGRKELDQWYIRNWSLWLDLIIFVKTVKVVLFGKGAK